LADVLDAGGFGRDALYAKLGIQLVEATVDRVVGSMPVEGNTQPYGVLHGGASIALAETLASIGAALHAGPTRVALGIEVNATHHRAARSGLVHAEATALHRGATVATYEVIVRDERGRRVCTARVSCVIRSREKALGGVRADHGVRPV